MTKKYEELPKRSKGAWVVHHGQKTASTLHAAAEFPALDTAAKAASLLSQLAATEEAIVEKPRAQALAQAAGLNPKLELPALLDILKKQRVIDVSSAGDVNVLGLTTNATVQHAADIFEDQEPTREERATIVVAELTSDAPQGHTRLNEYVADEFKLTKTQSEELLGRSETIGFVDVEGQNVDKLYFNGNLFRRDSISKAKRVLDSLASADTTKMSELDAVLSKKGCISVDEVEKLLGKPLFEKLRAASMYDVHHVANPQGEFGFVTKPSAFHKFNDPMADDAFDLAKALVSALSYGMTQSDPGRGKITMLRALLRKLNNGGTVGPATAIGEDYKVLELKGVIQVTKAPGYGYNMRLKKTDIGEMALAVLTTGEAASENVLDRPLPGKMTGYSGPESTRSALRKSQGLAGKKHTQDVLNALRTTGGF